MANPLFNSFRQPRSAPPRGYFANSMNLMQRFNEFKQNFQGNPQQKVQELLDSGQMTQAQFDELSSMAQQFQKMFR